MRRGGGPLTVLALAQAAATYEFTVAFVALPAIVADLHVAPSLVPWVPGAYAVVFGGGLLAAGRLADRHGPRRVVSVALPGLAATTAVVALAGSPTVLLAGRAGQGLAAAALQPAVLGAMTRVAAGAGRSRAWGVWSAVGAGGLALGAAAGGALTGVDWRLAVGVVVPVCLLAACASGVLPAERPVDPVRIPLVAAAVTTTAGVAAADASAAPSGGPRGYGVGGAGHGGGRGRRRRRGTVRDAAARPGSALLSGRPARRGPRRRVHGRTWSPVLPPDDDARRRRRGVTAGRGPGGAPTDRGGRGGGSAGAGRVLSRVGEERGAALGFGVGALGSAGLASGGLAGFVVSSVMAGVGSGLAFAAVFALAGGTPDGGRRGAAGSVVVAAQYLASAMALAAFGVLVGPVGRRGVLLLAGAASLAGAAAALAGRRRRARGDQGVATRPDGDPDGRW